MGIDLTVRFLEPRETGLVSVIMPVYNGERFIQEALDSIAGQGYPLIEIIVVDDGSTDSTREVVGGIDGPLRYYWQHNAGPASARNLGLRHSGGEFIAFLDADDLWLPGKLGRRVVCLTERPELLCCLGHIQNFWMDELADEAKEFEGMRFAEELPGFHLCATLARRRLFEDLGSFDPGLRTGSDTDWLLRMRDAGVPYEVLPDLVAKRRLHSGNLTRRDLASRDVLLRNLKTSLDRRRSDPQQ